MTFIIWGWSPSHTGYDLEANLALLKLYQFNPTHTDMKEEKKYNVVCFPDFSSKFHFLLYCEGVWQDAHCGEDPAEGAGQPPPHRLRPLQVSPKPGGVSLHAGD